MMLKKLKEKRASGNIFSIVVVISIIMISCVSYEYIRLTIIANGIKDALQSATISVATTNYDDVYNGLREGYSGGYQLEGDSWKETLDMGDIYQQIDNTLGLKKENGKHIKYAGDRIEYAIWDLDVDIKNSAFAPSNETEQFLATVTVKLEVPTSFAGESLPAMEITLQVKAGYTPKF